MDIASKIGFSGEKKLSSLLYETFSIVYVLKGAAQVSFYLRLYRWGWVSLWLACCN
jgi:hypothetical protein